MEIFHSVSSSLCSCPHSMAWSRFLKNFIIFYQLLQKLQSNQWGWPHIRLTVYNGLPRGSSTRIITQPIIISVTLRTVLLAAPGEHFILGATVFNKRLKAVPVKSPTDEVWPCIRVVWPRAACRVFKDLGTKQASHANSTAANAIQCNTNQSFILQMLCTSVQLVFYSDSILQINSIFIQDIHKFKNIYQVSFYSLFSLLLEPNLSACLNPNLKLTVSSTLW